MEFATDDNSLEAEFRKTLLIIKSHIKSLTNTKYISQYQVWLEKLSDTSLSEKRQRNIYLEELRKQIEAGVLQYPFTSPPPYGPLQPFEQFVQSTTRTAFCESEFSEESAYEYLTQYRDANNRKCQAQGKCKRYLSSPKTFDTHNRHFVTYLHPYAEKYEYYDRQNAVNDFYRHSPPPTMESPSDGSQAPNNSPATGSNDTSTTPRKEGENSWYDITDMSTATLLGESIDSVERDRGHGDHADPSEQSPEGLLRRNLTMEEFYRGRMQRMAELIEKLQQENKLLHENLEQVRKDLNFRDMKAETSIHNLTSEVDVLRNRLQELIDIKNSLKNGNLRSNTAEKELQTSRLKNIELQTTVMALQKKIHILGASKTREQNAARKKLLELHKEELEILKQIHQEQMVRAQNSYKQELAEKQGSYEQKVTEMKADYESKLAELTSLYDKLSAEKDQKIQHLEAVIKEQFGKIEQQISVIQEYFEGKKPEDEGKGKQYVLEKTMTKFLLKKYTKENKQLVSKLKRDLDIQKKSTELQLSAQKAALVTKFSTDKQQEIDDIVNGLESRYKFMFNQLQQQMVLMKSFDDKVISDLKQELIKAPKKKPNVRSIE